jgi:hypothetical protein
VIDQQFLEAVEPLNSAGSSTELMAPLLYSLVRSIKPRSVLEIGAGYTSLFILQALADNARTFARDRELVKEKARTVLRFVEQKDMQGAYRAWALAPPAHTNPGYYLEPYEPHFYCIDDFSESYSSAPKVDEIMQAMQLTRWRTFLKQDSAAPLSFSDQHVPFGLIFDDANLQLEQYWDLLDPDGGVLILHNTVNAHESNVQVLDGLKARQRAAPDELEVLSLVEPHKVNQNSFTMVRRTLAGRPRLMRERYEELIAQAMQLAST